jgi:hypothetical protein
MECAHDGISLKKRKEEIECEKRSLKCKDYFKKNEFKEHWRERKLPLKRNWASPSPSVQHLHKRKKKRRQKAKRRKRVNPYSYDSLVFRG